MSIHWWMASLYPALFAVGWFMTHLDRENPVRSPLYGFHKSLGLLTMLLLTWRIFVLLQVWGRKYSKRWPKFTSAWLRQTALHTLLYGFMWAVPLTGIFLSNSFKAQNVKFFGILMPDLFPQNQSLVGLASSFHFWFSYTFLAFIILHMIDQWKVVRALKRRFTNWLGQVAS